MPITVKRSRHFLPPLIGVVFTNRSRSFRFSAQSEVLAEVIAQAQNACDEFQSEINNLKACYQCPHEREPR